MAENPKNMRTDDLNYYLYVKQNNICRICLEKGSKLIPIFDPIKPPHFSVLIMACASVQVEDGDALPQFICHKCMSKLNTAFQLKSQCESADAKLRQCFKLFSQPDDLAKYINCNKELNSEITCEQTTQSDELSEENDSNELGCEPLLNKKALQQSLKTENLKSSTSTQENDEEELTALELSDSEPSDIRDVDVEVVISKGTDNQKPKQPLKEHQCVRCGKILSNRPGLVRHYRIHTGERRYACHLCDKRFINWGHLNSHMRTHTGEKNHICGACNKAFATAQHLNKHTISIHTSERPYSCKYCPKRFSCTSNLNSHLRVHSGVKNFHCLECGKAFSTNGQLLQHNLVHTGEKAFLCEFCNKRFSQKAHLVRHLNSCPQNQANIINK